MFKLSQKQTNWVLAGLIAIMAATRFSHFGSFNTLPDASLAVFFMAGLYVNRIWIFPLLLIEAGLIDYFAINHGGVSDYCMSNGYAFLIPAYAALWLSGRGFANERILSTSVAAKISLAIIAATGVAFLISNAGFYLYSGNFGALAVAEYFAKVIRYYPPYLTSTLIYSALIFASHGVFRYHLGRETNSQSSLR